MKSRPDSSTELRRPFFIKRDTQPGTRPDFAHFHCGFEFGVVVKGAVWRRHAGEQYMAVEGDAFLVDCTIEHGNRAYKKQPYEKILVGFRTDTLLGIAPERADLRLYMPFLALHAGASPIVKQAFTARKLLVEAQRMQASRVPDADLRAWPLIVSSLVDALLLKKTELESEPVRWIEKHAGTMNKAIEYLNAHFREPLSATQLAAHCNLSESRFRRLFSDIFKIAPIEYRNRLRIDYAADQILFS